MERQSSFGSEGSAASGKTSASKIMNEAGAHGSPDENNSSNSGFTTALFGVLYTLAKEKLSDSWKIAIITVVVDFLLILAIMLNLEYPWAVDPHNGVFKFFWLIEVHKPLASRGIRFYTIVFYLLSAMLYISVAICIWVAWCFKNDSFPFLWPIKFARVVVSFFFGMFYIAALNIYLVMLECSPYHGVWEHHLWHTECLTFPHLIHLIVAIISSVTFAVVALLLVVADHELEPMTKSLLAAPHSMCELRAQVAKTIITCTDILLFNYPKVQGVLFCVATVLTLYYHIKQLPYYTGWVNCMRCAFFGVHAWVGINLCLLNFMVDAKKIKTPHASMGFIEWHIKNYDTAAAITNCMAYGLGPVFLACGAIAAIRLYYFFRVSMRFQKLIVQPNLYSKRVFRFNEDFDVEVASRVARVWDEEGVLDQQCLDLAEVVIKAGLQQFPQSAYLHIVYANFLIECRQQLQGGWSQLEQARKLPLNLSFRFSIFTREQEHKQKAAVSSSGESAADLVSYVEFQRNYRLLQAYHKAALVATREFWRLLLHEKVDLNSLTRSFRKIAQMESLADKTYKTVLERYPKAVKLLRAYGNFLELVKNDPWTAAKYYAEADKQEEVAENEEAEMGDNNNDGFNARSSAIITINAAGMMQLVNKLALKMLGYKKGELEGKNISVLMPQPFSSRHNGYLNNYVTTGKPKILDTTREVVALHRDRYVFPIKILVTKASGAGRDATFMGMLKEVEPDPNQIKAWLLTNGVVLCVDQSFTDYAGWAAQELIGKPFKNVAADPDLIDKLLEQAAGCTEEELECGKVTAETMLHHKYADDVPVFVQLEMGGTIDQRLVVMTMVRRAAITPMAVFSHHGHVMFANSSLCSMLGYKLKDMEHKDIAHLLPQPFGYLHHKWMKEAEHTVIKPPISSCRSTIVHNMVSSNGTHVPVRMTISSKEYSGSVINVVYCVKVTPEEALDDRRWVLQLDDAGNVLAVGTAEPSNKASEAAVAAGDKGVPGAKGALFGFSPSHLLNRHVTDVLDIFQHWRDGGHDVPSALAALAGRAVERPGSSWRVGLLPHFELAGAAAMAAEGDDAAAADAAGQDGDAPQHNRSLVTVNSRGKRDSSMSGAGKPAVLQITMPEATDDGSDVRYVLTLWRPEMLLGVAELTDKLTIAKADATFGLILGVPHTHLHRQPISKYMKLAAPPTHSNYGHAAKAAASAKAGVTMDDLIGVQQGQSKGGMKGKVAHKTGARRMYDAKHSDGNLLSVSMQAALKDGTNARRVMLVARAATFARGNVLTLHRIVHDLDDEVELAMEGISTQPSMGMRGGEPPVPKLSLGALSMRSAATSVAAPVAPIAAAVAAAAPVAANTARTEDTGGLVTARDIQLESARTEGAAAPDTARTDGSALVTARDVGLDLATPRPDSAGAAGPSSPGARPLSAARLKAPSPLQKAKEAMSRGLSRGMGSGNGMSDDSAMAIAKKNKDKHKGPDGKDWQHVEHVDPDMVPIPEDAEYDIEHPETEKEMNVSSSDSDDDDDLQRQLSKMSKAEAIERKRTMAGMEEEEKVQYLRGVKRVKEWLASEYNSSMDSAKEADHAAAALKATDAMLPGSAAHGARPMSTKGRPSRGVSRALSRALSKVESEKGGDGGGKAPARRKSSGLDPGSKIATLGEQEEEEEEEDEEDEEEERRQSDEEREARLNGTTGGNSIGGDAASMVSASSAGGTMNRGKRLKRLLVLLSGPKVRQAVTTLRTHMWITVGIMALVHMVCYLILIIYINKQKEFITEISAAGEAIDLAHFTGMYSRAIEAAARESGFELAQIQGLAQRLDTDVSRLEYLHQGLYLGFKGLQKTKDKRLAGLWGDTIWNVTEYQDTQPPEFQNALMTLWNLGGEYISAVREVVHYALNGNLILGAAEVAAAAAAGTNTSGTDVEARSIYLPTNRFWLFVGANAAESLYTGYLRVLNTQLLLAQDNIKVLKTMMLVLLVVDGCLVCGAAIAYCFYLLWKSSRARAALFTVFLVIPSSQLKALANKNVNTAVADESDDSDEEGKDGEGGKKDDASAVGDEVGSVMSGAPSRRSMEMPSRRSMEARSMVSATSAQSPDITAKKGIKFNERTQVQHHTGDETVLGRIKRAISGQLLAGDAAAHGPPRRFSTRKRLTNTNNDIWRLSWPFVLWGVLVMVIYAVSFIQFAGVEESLVNLKMFERSLDQASRTTYYANELSLETDENKRLVLKAVLAEEAAWLDTVYSTTLYGGPTLEDSVQDGSHDKNTGSLFQSNLHAQLLFQTKACLRDNMAACFQATSAFYEVSRNAIDPMMRRLMDEARLMALDDLADIGPGSARWRYVWDVAAVDLHEGLEDLVSDYGKEALSAFNSVGLLHTVVFAISWALAAAYLFLLLRPYIKMASGESKRVAELLSQLPAELDVEAMVEESWRVVADTQLDVRRKSMSVNHFRSAMSVSGAAFMSMASVVIGNNAAMRIASILSGKSGTRSKGPSLDFGAGGFIGAAAAKRASVDANGHASALTASPRIRAGHASAPVGEEVDLDEDNAEVARTPGNKRLTNAPQVAVDGSSLFLPTSPAARNARGSFNSSRVAPMPSDSTPLDIDPDAPWSAKAAVIASRRASMDRMSVGADGTTRRSSMQRAKGNQVLPLSPSAIAPPAQPNEDGSRPQSPLLDLPFLALPPVAEEDGVGRGPLTSVTAGSVASRKPPVSRAAQMAAVAAAAAATEVEENKRDGAESPYMFNRVITIPIHDGLLGANGDKPVDAGDTAPSQAAARNLSRNLSNASGSVNLPPPPAALTPVSPGAALVSGRPGTADSGRMRVMDRRGSLDAARPGSPSGASAAAAAAFRGPSPVSPHAAAASGGVVVINRRGSLDTSGSRPASRLGLAPAASGIALPAPPTSRPGSGTNSPSGSVVPSRTTSKSALRPASPLGTNPPSQSISPGSTGSRTSAPQVRAPSPLGIAPASAVPDEPSPSPLPTTTSPSAVPAPSPSTERALEGGAKPPPPPPPAPAGAVPRPSHAGKAPAPEGGATAPPAPPPPPAGAAARPSQAGKAPAPESGATAPPPPLPPPAGAAARPSQAGKAPAPEGGAKAPPPPLPPPAGAAARPSQAGKAPAPEGGAKAPPPPPPAGAAVRPSQAGKAPAPESGAQAPPPPAGAAPRPSQAGKAPVPAPAPGAASGPAGAVPSSATGAPRPKPAAKAPPPVLAPPKAVAATADAPKSSQAPAPAPAVVAPTEPAKAPSASGSTPTPLAAPAP